MSNFSSYYGHSLPLVTVVEYLESSMSREILCKFPDNSAFDFNYAQSSIWSPLLPRTATPDANGRDLPVSRRLSFEDTDRVKLLENTKKMAAGIKRKFSDAVLHINGGRCTGMKRRKRINSIRFSPAAPTPSSRLPSSPKAWGKVMKAAANYFKKRKNNGHLTVGNLYS